MMLRIAFACWLAGVALAQTPKPSVTPPKLEGAIRHQYKQTPSRVSQEYATKLVNRLKETL